MLEKKVITINENKININYSELEKIINNSKNASNELTEIIKEETTLSLDNKELEILKDGKCIANYKIEIEKESPDYKYIHLCIVIQNNFGLMIDGVIDNSPVMKETELYKMNGIRFQPVLLKSENNEYPNFRGMGLFSRSLHFSGYVTPSNIRLCCICDECKKSFIIHSYHAGNGYFQYFYSDDGSETLMVPYYEIEDMPGQLCKNISKTTVEKVDAHLAQKGYGRFKFYNSFRCPYCKTPYIDFQKNPEIREYEYYANVFLNKKMIKYKENT